MTLISVRYSTHHLTSTTACTGSKWEHVFSDAGESKHTFPGGNRRAQFPNVAHLIKSVSTLAWALHSVRLQQSSCPSRLRKTGTMPPKKNPVAARIKKMMQADDDVGKIAQATPVLVCMFPIFSSQRLHDRVDAPLTHASESNRTLVPQQKHSSCSWRS